MNQGQWGSEEREGSMGKKAIRAIWVCQDSEVPRDNKDPQVNQVTRVDEDRKEREDLKVLRGKREFLVLLGSQAFPVFQAFQGQKACKDTMELTACQDTLESLGYQENKGSRASQAAQEEQDWLDLQVLREERVHQALQEVLVFQAQRVNKGCLVSLESQAKEVSEEHKATKDDVESLV